jgi:hypothetical protein
MYVNLEPIEIFILSVYGHETVYGVYNYRYDSG